MTSALFATLQQARFSALATLRSTLGNASAQPSQKKRIVAQRMCSIPASRIAPTRPAAARAHDDIYGESFAEAFPIP